MAMLLILVPSAASARVRANVEGRVVLNPEQGTAAKTLEFSAQAVSPAPVAAGAVVLDSTWYDLQDMGSIGHRIEVGADGRVHATWQDEFCHLGGGCPPDLSAPQPYPHRGMDYAWRATNGVWTKVGKVQDPLVPVCCASADRVGGFGALALTATGRAAIAQHLNEDGCDLHGYFHLQSAPGTATWKAQLTPVATPSFLFPQVAVTPGGRFTVLGEVPRGGQYDETTEIRTSTFATEAGPYACFAWPGGAWSTIVNPALFRDGRPAFPCIAAASDGRVGVAVGDFGGNVYLVESSNGSFAAGTVTTRPLTSYTDAQVTATDSTSTQFRAFVHCHLAYNDTTPHVVWSELQARKSGASVVYFDHRSRIRMWSPTRGLETVYQVPAGVADRFDDVDQGLAGPLAGFNTLSVDWPQVGFSADGHETYVTYLAFRDSQVDPTADAGLPGIVTGIGFGDMWCAVARGGLPWSAPENLTNTPTTDERFFSLATRNPGGRLHLIYQCSATDQAGVVIIGDRGTTPGNILRRIAYLEKRPVASVVGVELPTAAPVRALRASPNPVHSGAIVQFAFTPADAPRSIEIVDVSGRRVATFPAAAREGQAIWNGRAAGGTPLHAGVFLARFAGDGNAAATRFVVLR